MYLPYLYKYFKNYYFLQFVKRNKNCEKKTLGAAAEIDRKKNDHRVELLITDASIKPIPTVSPLPKIHLGKGEGGGNGI